MPNANPQLETLVPYEPGKPIEDVARELGLDPDQIIKLASNENPIGPSPEAVRAMKEAAESANFYPDGGGYKLRNAIAEKFGLDRTNVILGNGSNEIIEFVGHAFLQPGDDIIVADHAFVVYKLMATLFGANTIEVPDPGFVHDLEAMAAAVTPRTKQLFIANPNNPTGTLVGIDAIERLLDKIPEHVVVVIDEAYYEFLDTPPTPSNSCATDATSWCCEPSRRSRAWQRSESDTASPRPISRRPYRRRASHSTPTR